MTLAQSGFGLQVFWRADHSFQQLHIPACSNVMSQAEECLLLENVIAVQIHVESGQDSVDLHRVGGFPGLDVPLLDGGPGELGQLDVLLPELQTEVDPLQTHAHVHE